MNFLADSWVLWFIITVLMLVGMVLYRHSRRNVTSTFSSADDFSVRTIFFNMRRGEADLFLGFLVAMISFSLFVLGVVRWGQTILQ
jgi:preprotein translocase subunit SecG